MLVSTKPFATNYRIPTPTGFVVLNGHQITKIVATKGMDLHTLEANAWTVTFHLSDGSTQEIRPNAWTKNFVREVFELDVDT